jgi:surface antigen
MNSGLSFALSHVPDQHAVVWVNRDSRLYGEIVPLKTYRTSYGQVCREYASLSFTSSGQQQGFGMACRQDDGSWQLAGQKSVRGSMNGALVHAKNQAQLCSYFSHWHPPVKGMVQPRKRYHSEEFLRQYQHAPRQRLPSPVTIPQLVVN